MLNLQTMSNLFSFQCAGIVSYITYQHANEMSVPYQFPDLRAQHIVYFQVAVH